MNWIDRTEAILGLDAEKAIRPQREAGCEVCSGVNLKMTLMAIAFHAQKGGECWLHQEDLCARAGIGRRSLLRALRVAEALKVLSVKRSQGRSRNRYSIDYQHLAGLARLARRGPSDGRLDAPERRDRCAGAAPQPDLDAPERRDRCAGAAPQPDLERRTQTGKNMKENKGGVPVAVTWDPELHWQGITDRDREHWQSANPGVDLDQELAAMTDWLLDDWPARAKKRWRAFISGWLRRAADRCRPHQDLGSQATPRFTAQDWNHLLAEEVQA